jgi:mannitol/fructose-specific phosphotransferase system IIA component (Ntr-type)
VNFRRYLCPEAIRLELETRTVPDEQLPPDWDPDTPANLRRIREDVIRELTDLLEKSGKVVNPSRLYRDLHNREKRAVTAIGQGIALPHVRSLQVKSFVMAFGRSTEGLLFGAPDEEPVHLFFALAAPPYEDKTYLRVYPALSRAFLAPGTVDEFMAAEEPGEILRTLKRFDTRH